MNNAKFMKFDVNILVDLSGYQNQGLDHSVYQFMQLFGACFYSFS